jgi:hypothetical protein
VKSLEEADERKEKKERIRIGATPEEEDSTRIPKEVVGESDPMMPKDVESHHEIDMVLHTNVTPQVKEFHSGGKGTSLNHPVPQCYLQIW